MCVHILDDDDDVNTHWVINEVNQSRIIRISVVELK